MKRIGKKVSNQSKNNFYNLEICKFQLLEMKIYCNKCYINLLYIHLYIYIFVINIIYLFFLIISACHDHQPSNSLNCLKNEFVTISSLLLIFRNICIFYILYCYMFFPIYLIQIFFKFYLASDICMLVVAVIILILFFLFPFVFFLIRICSFFIVFLNE